MGRTTCSTSWTFLSLGSVFRVHFTISILIYLYYDWCSQLSKSRSLIFHKMSLKSHLIKFNPIQLNHFPIKSIHFNSIQFNPQICYTRNHLALKRATPQPAMLNLAVKPNHQTGLLNQIAKLDF